MKTVRVVAAVICDSLEYKTKIFAMARGYEEYRGQWELPGGKIEPGEMAEVACWLTKDILTQVAWLLADRELLDKIRQAL